MATRPAIEEPQSVHCRIMTSLVTGALTAQEEARCRSLAKVVERRTEMQLEKYSSRSMLKPRGIIWFGKRHGHAKTR
jgi:hypothetical protein